MAFAGKRIVLTGASAGIGAELARQLAREKARLVLAARRMDRLEALAEECRSLGAAEAIPVETDVGEQAACEQLIRRAGEIDLLLLNAGITMGSLFEEVKDLSIFEQLIRVNYLSAVWLTHAALPSLKRSRGQIVAVSSLTGRLGIPTRTGYAASKHALQGFFDSLRVELLGSGVGITVVSPGFVQSEIREKALSGQGGTRSVALEDESRSMTAEECARRILAAARKRKRDEVMTLAGKAAVYLLQPILPGLMDRLARKRLGLP